MTGSRLVWGALVPLVLSGCSAFGADGTGPETGDAEPEVATAEVVRGDLTQTSTTSGQLEYGAARDLSSLAGGVVTRLPANGRIVGEGEPLFRIDNVPVVRLDGRTPAWRDLGPDASDGPDVRQVERALERHGYTDDLGMAVDDDWTWVTTIAVERWQEDLGLAETGELPLGSVVFTRGDVRVVDALVDEGTPVQPGTAVLQVGDTQRAVTVSIEPDQKHLAPVDGKVELTFPDGTEVTGTIAEVVTVAGSQEQQTEDSLAVTVEVPDKRAVRSQLDGASVRVDFTHTIAEDVLSVPVTALVALAAGGYGVEKVTGDTTGFVAVTPGTFADTDVEISGDDLAAGDLVVVTP